MSTRQSCSCVLFFLSSFLDVFFFSFPITAALHVASLLRLYCEAL